MLHPCTNATKLNYFDGSKAGFGIFIIVLFLFPVGQYHTHKSPASLHTKNTDMTRQFISPYSQSASGLRGGASPEAQVQEV